LQEVEVVHHIGDDNDSKQQVTPTNRNFNSTDVFTAQYMHYTGN